ncbi:polyprenyl glycosylphosphotransferase [Arthrobacter sp. ERGS1:01]|uniref:sugar transferase n=1 Tax=Arthrobacter sp. ERGS1:01 TaxID=1704044 RepID=UPI0006B47D4F|nr:sugar transferase [Arthrobacter sp. ERGS1:01]ALE05164.1 polyprenyl glycosylphosphotransferase [Arthrobacter sp. ERGS1:01]
MNQNNWRSRYAKRIWIVDAIVVIWAAVGAHLIRFGLDGDETIAGARATPYFVMTLILPVVWWIMLEMWDSRASRILGSGPDEYKRVFAASLWLFGALAIFSYAFQVDVARGYVGIAFPLGVFGLAAGRWVLRQHLTLDRSGGRSVSRLLLVGGDTAVTHLIDALKRHPMSGYKPVGTYLPGADATTINAAQEIRVLGTEPSVAGIMTAVRNCDADMVALSGGTALHPTTMRHLGWALAEQNIGLIVAPALTDIAGPRIHTQPIAGLPLIHVTTPKLEGGKRVAKRTFDLVGASLLVAFLSPVLATLAVLTKLSSPGPVFYMQDRIGVHGTTFRMIKFRSMMVDADLQLAGLLQAQGTDDKPLFKVENDPRITRVGRVLRKFSLDELPQLFNVLMGSMSLVGPRPQRDGEVALYDDAARRRLYVQPGMSGLWQVSGRSNLSWDESIRLDLYYVENWSLTTDLVILFRTAKAVVGSNGAV